MSRGSGPSRPGLGPAIRSGIHSFPEACKDLLVHPMAFVSREIRSGRLGDVQTSSSLLYRATNFPGEGGWWVRISGMAGAAARIWYPGGSQAEAVLDTVAVSPCILNWGKISPKGVFGEQKILGITMVCGTPKFKTTS